MLVSELSNTLTVDRGKELERNLSLLLFKEIKPCCISLSQIALLPLEIFKPDSPRLVLALQELESLLISHKKANLETVYRLSTNIADYIFFPISNLLKQPSLSDLVTKHILYILGFLIQNAWAHHFDPKLIDQLFPLVVFLSSGSQVLTKEFEFQKNACFCITNILDIITNDYFQGNDIKRLSLLGDSTTVLLDVLSSLKSSNLSQEQTELAVNILNILNNLYSRKVSDEQTSYVFPGMISKVINFSTSSRSHHASLITAILKLMKSLILRVFDDKSLSIEVSLEDNTPTFEGLLGLWDSKIESIEDAPIKFTSNIKSDGHRTNSWLKATAKQLKLSLTVFCKDLLFTSSKQYKIKTNTGLFEVVISFNEAIISHCYYSLFMEFMPLSLDLFSTLISIRESEECDVQRLNRKDEQSVNQYTSMIIDAIRADHNKLELLYLQVRYKLEDAIDNNFSTIMFLLDESKIMNFVSSLKFNSKLLLSLSEILNKDVQVFSEIIKRLVFHLKSELFNSITWNNRRNKKANKNDLLAILGDHSPSQDESTDINKKNTLDDIELPPSINAKQVTSIRDKKSSLTPSENKKNYSMNLEMLARQWATGGPQAEKSNSVLKSFYFGDFYSSLIECRLMSLLCFLSSLQGHNAIIESLLVSDDLEGTEKSSEVYLNKSLSLWTANILLAQSQASESKNFRITDFLNIDDPVDDDNEEVLYMVMTKSQELIDEVAEFLNEPETMTSSSDLNPMRVYQMSYCIAIDSIGILSDRLPKEDFQSDYLIDYLFPLLEALTFTSSPSVQYHAAASLAKIVENYYDSSLSNLILDNLDYLINSLSLKLSTPSSLNLALPGILLIVLKISGLQLLLDNQLQDIISQMFILIDSYHGYSILVEGFFVVFEEIIKQLSQAYVDQNHLLNIGKNQELSLKSVDELLVFLDNSNNKVDPLNVKYDSSTEYFKRKKPNTPFEEEIDSDDEDAEGPEPVEESDDIWKSPVPKNIYLISQQIFNYGFQLMSHPSLSLKRQILKTMKEVYPLLGTSYDLVIPLVSQHWPILLSMITGITSLSQFQDQDKIEQDQLIIPSLELVNEMIRVDNEAGTSFLGRKFIEAWEFMSGHSRIFSTNTRASDSKAITEYRSFDPKALKLYVEFLILGVTSYSRIIPDLIIYDILRNCFYLGIPETMELTNEIRGVLWVIKRQS